MKSLIYEYIKSLHIRVILRNQTLENEGLSFIQTDFIGIDDKYYSILVAFNDTYIFNASSDMRLLGSQDNAMIGSLVNNVKVFDSRDEWIQGRYPEINNKLLTEFNKMYAGYSQKEDCEYNNFRLVRVYSILAPLYAIIVDFEYKGVLQHSLVLSNTQKVSLNSFCYRDLDDFYSFLKILNLSEYVDYKSERLEVFQ